MKRVLTWCRERPWTWALAAGVACGAAGYGTGRFAAPTKVIERTSTSTQAQAQATASAKMTVAEGPVKITRRRTVTPGPNGPVVQLDTVIERSPVLTTTESQASGASSSSASLTTERVTERDAPRLTLALTIGAGFSSGGITQPSYGVLALGRVAGPLVVGAQAEGNMTSGSARAILGLTF
jgi:hypothetical protein